MNLILAYAGRFSIGIIRDTFGVGSNLTSALIIFCVGVMLTIVMFRVNWEKYREKYLLREADSGKSTTSSIDQHLERVTLYQC